MLSVVRYTGAITETKVLVIVIDVGPSSSGPATSDDDAETKLSVAQTAAEYLLYSLKAGDSVSVVTFGDADDVQIVPSSDRVPTAKSPEVPVKSHGCLLDWQGVRWLLHKGYLLSFAECSHARMRNFPFFYLQNFQLSASPVSEAPSLLATRCNER